MSRIATALVVALITLIAASALAGEGRQADQDTDQESASSTKQESRPRMDVVFAIDATGSMGDEIDVIKKEVWAIANRLVTGKPAPDIRFGLVLYRDTSDSAQVVEVTGLTRDIDAIHGKLMATVAQGGGDKPEHVGRGLHASLALDWDRDPAVKRTIYLVGDAGAAQRDQFTVETALLRAKEMGVKINAIGCSGLTVAERGEFDAIASRTGGGFEALTYYAVVEGDDGGKHSVVYYDGDVYETEGELTDAEWKKGGATVVKERAMKKAAPKMRSKAKSAPKRNNLDSVVSEEMMLDAAAMGVDY